MFLGTHWTAVRVVCEGLAGVNREEQKGVLSMTIIVASVVAAMSLGVLLTLALARAAALADENSDRMLTEHTEQAPITGDRLSYAGFGFARAHSTIARESSITEPSSRTSVGTQRLPVSSVTSRRPLV